MRDGGSINWRVRIRGACEDGTKFALSAATFFAIVGLITRSACAKILGTERESSHRCDGPSDADRWAGTHCLCGASVGRLAQASPCGQASSASCRPVAWWRGEPGDEDSVRKTLTVPVFTEDFFTAQMGRLALGSTPDPTPERSGSRSSIQHDRPPMRKTKLIAAVTFPAHNMSVLLGGQGCNNQSAFIHRS